MKIINSYIYFKNYNRKMNNNASCVNKKIQTGDYMNKNEEYLHKNNSNISIHHRSKLRSANNQIKYENDKETENSYFLAPVYQTLKTENYIQNIHYQPSINLIGDRINNIDDKYLARQNTVLSLKSQTSQTSYNGKIINSCSNRLNNEKKEFNKNKSVLNYNINDKSLKSNSSFYKNIYCSPNRNPETLLINPVKYKDTSYNISEKYLSNKKPKNTIPKFDNKNIDRSRGIKNNHFEKKIFNSKNNNKNIEIKVYDLEKGYIENYKLSKIKYNKEKPKELIKNEKSSKSIKYTENSDNNNFNNNFFYKMEVNKPNNKNKSMENKEKSKKNSFKSIKKENNRKLNINSFKLENNLKLNSMSTSNKSLNSYSLYKKGLEILAKIANNKKYKYWLSFKQKINNIKKFIDYKSSTGKIIKSIYLQNIPPIDNQKQISSTLDYESYYKNNSNFIKYKDRSNINLRHNFNSENQKIYELLSENLELKKINSNILEDKNELVKKLEIIKEQNKKNSKSQRTNNLMLENQLLNEKLKKIYTKYLFLKNIYNKQNKLKIALFRFNKKAITLKYQSKKKKAKLYKMVKLNEYLKNKILRKYFYKYYYIIKYFSFEKEEYYYEEIRKKNIRKEKLLNIFHKREKNNYIKINNSFNKLYYNSLLNNEKNKSFVIIHNENLNINKKNNNSFEKIKRKLKIIIKNIITKNDIIVRSTLKQWNLRTKLEKNKKIINPIENSLKNKRINNSKEDNIIKGIEKLNDIFITYRNEDKNNNRYENHKKEVKDIFNPKINNNMNNISSKNENKLNKINGDKLKYGINNDWIIEEKEEEQVEENGESTSAKNDTDHIIEDNIYYYNNIAINEGKNNNENYEG